MKYLWLIILILLAIGCKTVKYVDVPVETVRTEYVYGNTIDSIIIRDSVDRLILGDIIYINRTHAEKKSTNKVDTITRIDSIPKIVTVEKVIEVNKPPWWQKVLMWVGGIVLAILIIVVIYKIAKKIR